MTCQWRYCSITKGVYFLSEFVKKQISIYMFKGPLINYIISGFTDQKVFIISLVHNVLNLIIVLTGYLGGVQRCQ